MTDAQPRQTSDAHSDSKRKRLIARLIVFALLFAFALVKPKVDAWLAANPLPGTEQAAKSAAGDDSLAMDPAAIDLHGGSDTGPEISSADTARSDSVVDHSDLVIAATAASPNSNGRSATASAESNPQTATQSSAGSKSRTSKSTAGTSDTAAGKDQRSNPAARSTSTAAGSSKTDRSNPSSASSTEGRPAKDPPGKLSLIAGTQDEFRSTAGLMYVRGSQDGHRLKHVLKHAEDNLDKPIHGVFQGDRDQILAWIDIAYTKGKQGGKGVRVEKQGGRVVYTVDLGEKIGVVGGQVGDRKGNPPCRFLRLVVQNGNEVVTAYPSQSL